MNIHNWFSPYFFRSVCIHGTEQQESYVDSKCHLVLDETGSLVIILYLIVCYVRKLTDQYSNLSALGKSLT